MYDNSPSWAAPACFFLCLLILIGTVAFLFMPMEAATLGEVVFAKVYLGVHGILGGLAGMSSTIDSITEEETK
jgi:hypothetical protein